MRKATWITARLLGLSSGLAAIEHGIFEILRGNTCPEGLVIASMGPPCDPEAVWNACEPAMTILPNFLVTGILTVLFGSLITVWSLGFLRRKGAGWVLLGLSILSLLFGGGFFPPLIGIVASLATMTIRKPFKQPGGAFICFLGRLWPVPLVGYLVWVVAQWPIGYLFNDTFIDYMIYGVIFILLMLPLSVITAAARDRSTGTLPLQK